MWSLAVILPEKPDKGINRDGYYYCFMDEEKILMWVMFALFIALLVLFIVNRVRG